MITIVVIDNLAVKLNDATGETWLLVENEDEKDIYEWVKIKDREIKTNA